MKYIIAIIKPHKLEAVREAITSLQVHGMTITEVKGYGRQRGQKEIYRGAEYQVNFIPKIKIEVAVDDGIADQVIEKITASARTGQIGDGKVFIMDLGDALRIRTGEHGKEAL